MKKFVLLPTVFLALSVTLLGCEQKQTPAQAPAAPAASAPANPETPTATPGADASKSAPAGGSDTKK